MKQVYQFTEIVAAQAGAAIAGRKMSLRIPLRSENQETYKYPKKNSGESHAEILYVNERRQRMVGRRYGLVI